MFLLVLMGFESFFYGFYELFFILFILYFTVCFSREDLIVCIGFLRFYP